MNRTEYLLVQAASECSEVAHNVTKAFHFGVDKIEPGHTKTNGERIVQEYLDLLGAFDLLFDDGTLTMVSGEELQAAITQKKVRIGRFMEIALADI